MLDRFYAVSLLLASWAIGAVPSETVAETTSYFLNDPQKLSAANITIDSRLRPIRGYISEFEGTLRVDSEDVSTLQGDIRISLDKLHLGSFLVTEEVLSDRWLDSVNYPEIQFVIKGVEDVKRITETTWSLTARSAMVLKGRAGGIDFPATIEFIPNGMTDRTGGRIDGDLVVLRGELEFRPALWGLKGESSIVGGVGGLVEIDFSAIGYTMRSGRK